MMFWLIVIGVSITVTALLLGPLWRSRAVFMLMSVPIASILLYQQWGAYSEVQHATMLNQRLVEVKRQIAHDGSRRTLIKQFEEQISPVKIDQIVLHQTLARTELGKFKSKS